MSPTEPYTATLYVVESGAVALHDHDRLGRWLPPGGHVETGEAPHEAALREATEETGLSVSIATGEAGIETGVVDPLPRPRRVHRIDLEPLDGDLDYSVVDFVYFGRAESRGIDPRGGEAAAGAWEWFTAADLRDRRDDLPDDVVEYGRQAIAAVGSP